MMIHLVRLLAAAVVISMAPAQIFAHGITRAVEEGRGIVVTALYDDGEPISYALIKVYGPEDRKVEYQNGRTDAQGRFVFVPSAPGDWLVRLDDGTGHGFDEHVRVDADLRGTASSPVLVKFMQKVIVLLLLSWGGIMTALYVRKRKLE